MAADDSVIRIRFEAQNEQAAVTAFDRVAKSAATSEASVKRFDSSAKLVANDTFKQLNDASARSARLIGAFGSAAGAAIPQLGGLGSAVTRSAEVITSMGAYLGGPWGIAIGAAVAAVGLLSAAFKDAEKDAETLEEAIANIGKNKTDVQIARLAQVEAKNYAARLKALSDSGFFKSVTESNKGVTLADVNAAEAAADKAGLIFDRSNKDGGKKKEPGEFTAFGLWDENSPEAAWLKRRDAADKSAQQLRDIDRQVTDNAIAEANRGVSAQLESIRTRSDARKAALAEEIDAERQAHAEMIRIATQADEEIVQSSQQKRQVAIDVAQTTASVGIDAIHKLVKGHKVSAKEIIATFGDQMVAKGTGHILEAAAFAFIPGMQASAGGLAAAGAAEVGFGLVLGAATRGGGSGGSGGGGGGYGGGYGGGRVFAGGTSDDVSPNVDKYGRPVSRAMSPGGYGGSGANVTNINVQMSSLLRPTEEDGKHVRRAIEEAQRAGI